MGSLKKWPNIIASRKRSSSAITEAAPADKKPSRWKLWKIFRFIDRGSARVGKEAGKKQGAGNFGGTNLAREEKAAVCIQTAFRGFLAKRALRALKGLVHLQAAISGHDARKQSPASLHCIQAFVRVQARIHRQRAIQSRDALGLPQQEATDLTAETHTTDSEMQWCNTLGTLEEIQAKEQERHVAAIKRERAIAYAFCNKWKANAKVNPGSLFDYELDNSTWSWIWLDEWLNGRPKKHGIEHQNGKQCSQIATQKDGARRKIVLKKTAAVGIKKYANAKASPDKSNASKKALTRAGSLRRTLQARAVSDVKVKGVKVLSLKPDVKLQPEQSFSQSKQHPSKDAKRNASVPNLK
eukprot:c20838_g1_i1 orf=303-1364(+)